MFKNVLVIDDHAAVNQGIVQTLKNNTEIPQIAFTQYCEDAYIKFQKAQLDNNPFDLIISDLTFKVDHRTQTIKSGLELVELLRDKQPNIKVIIYSIEDRKSKIESYINRYKINGFISKGRHGLKELLEAIPSVWDNILYTSKALNLTDHNSPYEIDDIDVLILKELAQGISQKEIADLLQYKNTKFHSLSSIEKRINKLKIHFTAKNTTHLIAIGKDLGII